LAGEVPPQAAEGGATRTFTSGGHAMKVGVVGIGAMGFAMARHVKEKGFEISTHARDPNKIARAKEAGLNPTSKLEELAKQADLFIAVVNTDDQSREVTEVLSQHAREGAMIAIAATNSPFTMQELAKLCASRGKRFIDAPFVYGGSSAESGRLLSLVGGSEEDFEWAKPALMSYCRDVLHVGPVGAGQLAKACNNLLHWVHCVSNYETLVLAKRFGVDAQRMREVLLKCPAYNGTLDRWDTSKFTWQEKDMDVTMDLAQYAGVVLPLAGQTDQLIKLLTPADVKALLYGPECEYLGVTVKPMTREEGGLG
jgi:3-hydroxyisobutyrate dehydrogenase-like beta-hydroxyacid dehydrogenase